MRSRLFPTACSKTNTIFEVVKAAGGARRGRTSTRPYDLVNGPSGRGESTDLFTPEITKRRRIRRDRERGVHRPEDN